MNTEFIKKIFLSIFIIILIILFVIFCVYYFKDDVSNFTSSIDNKQYKIRSSDNKEEQASAANYLSQVSLKVTKLVQYAHDNQLPNKATADRLYHRWKNCELRETSSTDNSVAFTVNKGHEIRLCIRDKDGNFEDPNVALFVILHEIGHLMSVSYGHNKEFDDNFNFITHLASYLGLYKPDNFAIRPRSYCGISINTTPCAQGTCKTRKD